MKVRLLLLGFALPLLLAADDFKEFTSKEGRFTVLMPGTPKEMKVPIKGKDKDTTQYQFVVDRGKGAYLVSYQDNPGLEKAGKEKLDEALTAGRKKVEEVFQGKVLSEKKIVFDDKYPGLTIEVDIPKQAGICRSRLYLVNGRLYQVIAVGEKEFATSKDTDKFLESFKLLK